MKKLRCLKRTLLFVCPSLAGGGAEKTVLSYLKYWDREKFSLKLLLFNKTGVFLSEIPADVQTFFLNKKNKVGAIRLIWEIAFSILPKVKPDLVVSFMWYANLIILMARLFSPYKPNVFISERVYASHDPQQKRGWVNFLKHWLYPKAEKILAVSKGIKKELLQRLPSLSHKIEVVYNGVDFKKIKSLSQKSIKEKMINCFKGEKIIACGRLSKQKNYPLLFEALKALKPELKWQAYILGEGPERNYLEKIVSQLGLKEKIIFLGFKDNPYAYFKRATLFVLSSLFEGFPNSLLEALACGLPAVVCNCPTGPDEIIQKGRNGFLVPINNAFKLKESLEKIMLNQKLKQKLKKGALASVKKFDLCKTISRLEELCLNQLNKK